MKNNKLFSTTSLDNNRSQRLGKEISMFLEKRVLCGLALLKHLQENNIRTRISVHRGKDYKYFYLLSLLDGTNSFLTLSNINSRYYFTPGVRVLYTYNNFKPKQIKFHLVI